MIKKYLFSLFFLTFSSSLFYAHCNVKHKPEHIFERTARGQKIINPRRATGVDKLHSMGYVGRNVKIAFIDSEIHPEAIGELRSNIHPSIFQNKFVLTPEERLELLNLRTLKEDQTRKLNDFNNLPYDVRMRQGRKTEEELNKLGLTIERKEYFDKINSYKKQELENSIALHGVCTLRLLHLIAPQSQLFPFDLNAPLSSDFTFNPFVTFVKKAIENKVDVINLCCTPGAHNQDFTNALIEAIHKGITVIFSAGNASSKTSPLYTNRSKLSDNTFIKSVSQQVLEATQGKGLLYAGSLGYSFPKGEEIYSDFSQHPTSQALKNHILAPGEFIRLKRLRDWQGIYSGTSVSAPILTGSFALLKDYAERTGLIYNRENLLTILQQSGHNLRHNIAGVTADTYKVLNMSNAIEVANKTLQKKRPNVQPVKTTNQKKPTSSLKKRTVVKKRNVIKTKPARKITGSETRTVRKRRIVKQKGSLSTQKRALKPTKKRKTTKRKAKVTVKKRIAQSKKRTSIKGKKKIKTRRTRKK